MTVRLEGGFIIALSKKEQLQDARDIIATVSGNRTDSNVTLLIEQAKWLVNYCQSLRGYCAKLASAQPTQISVPDLSANIKGFRLQKEMLDDMAFDCREEAEKDNDLEQIKWAKDYEEQSKALEVLIQFCTSTKLEKQNE